MIRRVWIGLLVLYLIFFGWYTSFAGPLDEDEIAHFVAVLEGSGEKPERIAVWRTFMETDTGDDFGMLNLTEMRETPGSVPGVPPGESSEEVLERYTRPFLGSALLNGGTPRFSSGGRPRKRSTYGESPAPRNGPPARSFAIEVAGI